MSMNKIKTYLKGFFKGLGLLLIVFVMAAILEILHKPNIIQEILQQFLEGIFFIAFTAYFVRKHNQSETWILCSHYRSFLVLLNIKNIFQNPTWKVKNVSIRTTTKY